jgi:hypothetical protein
MLAVVVAAVADRRRRRSAAGLNVRPRSAEEMGEGEIEVRL